MAANLSFCSDAQVVQHNGETNFGSKREIAQKRGPEEVQIVANATVSSCGVVPTAAVADEFFCPASDVILQDRASLLFGDETLIHRTPPRSTSTPTPPPLDSNSTTEEKLPFTATPTSTLTTKPEALAVTKSEEEDVLGSSAKKCEMRARPEQQLPVHVVLLNTTVGNNNSDKSLPVVEDGEGDLSTSSNSNSNSNNARSDTAFPHLALRKEEDKTANSEDALPPEGEKEARLKEEVLATIAAAVAQWGTGDLKALAALTLSPAEKRIVRNEETYVHYIRTLRRQRTEEKNKRTSDNVVRRTTTTADLSSSGMSLGVGMNMGWSVGGALPPPSSFPHAQKGFSVLYSHSAYSSSSPFGGGPLMQGTAQPAYSPFVHGAHNSSFEYEKLKIIHSHISLQNQQHHQQQQEDGSASFSPYSSSSPAPLPLVRPQLANPPHPNTNAGMNTSISATVYNTLLATNHYLQSHTPMNALQRSNQMQMQHHQHQHQHVQQSLHFRTAEFSHRHQDQQQQFLPTTGNNNNSSTCTLRAPSCTSSNHIVQYMHNAAAATPHHSHHGGVHHAQRYGDALHPFPPAVPVTSRALPSGEVHAGGCHSARSAAPPTVYSHQFAGTMQQQQLQQQNTVLAVAPHSPYRAGASAETSAVTFTTTLPDSSFNSASASSSRAAVPQHATSAPAFFFSSPATASTTASPTLPPTHLPPQQTHVSSATHFFPTPIHMYAMGAPQTPSLHGDGNPYAYAATTPTLPHLQHSGGGAMEQQIESMLSASLLTYGTNNNGLQLSQRTFPSNLSFNDQNAYNNSNNNNNMFINSHSFASVGGFDGATPPTKLFFNTNTNKNDTNLTSVEMNASQTGLNQIVMTQRPVLTEVRGTAIDTSPTGRNPTHHMYVAERERREQMAAVGLSSSSSFGLGGMLQQKFSVAGEFHSSVAAADFSDRPLPPAPVGDVFLMKPDV